MGENKRLDYIDWAKAVSIVLIVLGHMLPGSCWPKVLMYAFHVPIFALVGGMLHKTPQSWSDVAKKMLGLVTRLFIPYVIWFSIFSIFYFLPEEEIPRVVGSAISLEEIAKRFLFLEGKSIWNAAMWFMPCYFVVSLLFVTFTKLTRGNRYISLALSAVLFGVVIAIDKLGVKITVFEIENAFRLKNYFLIFGFVAFGYFVRPIIDKLVSLKDTAYKNPIPYISGVLFIITSVICLKSNEIVPTKSKPGGYYTLSMYSGLYNDILLFIVFALLLSLFLVLFLSILPKSKIAERLSRGSLLVLLTHYFFFLEESFLSFKKTEWITDMNIGFRDATFIILLYIALFYLFDILSKYKLSNRLLKFFGYIAKKENTAEKSKLQ